MYITSRPRRSSDQGLLVVPSARLKTKIDRAFKVGALPLVIPPAVSVDASKKQLRTHQFKLTFVLPYAS